MVHMYKILLLLAVLQLSANNKNIATAEMNISLEENNMKKAQVQLAEKKIVGSYGDLT